MKKKHMYLLLCFLWMFIIFWFSAQVADDSQGMSDNIIKMIDQIFHIHIVENGGWLFDVVSFMVRKAAHMSEYALLAILYAFYLKEVNVRRYLLVALAGTFLYACSDEIHQLFVEGRSGQLQDVLIDTLGGSVGLCFMWVVSYCRIKFKKKKA